MNESDWVKLITARLEASKVFGNGELLLKTGLKLAYGCEIISYGDKSETQEIPFETDLAIIESMENSRWKPRVIVEAKLGSVATHDAITYSQKAASHRAVHPYPRYGMMLGERKHHPLPGRLYRHGAQFDFMISFCEAEPTKDELTRFTELLNAEVEASKTLEKILYDRRRDRDHYTLLHRQLKVQ